MIENIIVDCKEGLHASKCSEIVRKANSYESEITLSYNEQKIDLKSILGLLSLCVNYGEKVTLEFDGKDSKEAFNELKKLFA